MIPGDLPRIAQRLPRRPGLHRVGGGRDFVVFVPLVLVDGEYHILLEKRARGIRQEREICFPGGSVEPELDRSPEETALRETREELGIAEEELTILGRMDAVVTHWGGLIDVVVGTTEIESVRRCRPSEQEVERILLVPVSFFEQCPPDEYTLRVEIQPSFVDEKGEEHVLFPARALGLPERYWRPWDRSPHAVYAYRYDGETIWGMTAALIRRFVAMLQEP